MGVAGREIRKGLENSQTESANALVQKVEKCDDRRVAVLDEEDIRKKNIKLIIFLVKLFCYSQ